MEKKDRLLKLIEHYSNGNKSEFARMIGVSPQAVNTWISRNTFDIDIIYAKCVNILPEWLLTGKGAMLKTSSNNKTNVEQEQVSTNKTDESTPLVTYDPNVEVPYYDVDFVAGFDLIINDQTFLPTANIVVYGFEKAQMWCNATGNSMYPKICHGDMIALRECTLEDVQYGEIYAVVLDTIRTIKILRKSEDPNKFRFIPINTEEYDEQEFCKSRILRVFEVLGNVSRFM